MANAVQKLQTIVNKEKAARQEAEQKLTAYLCFPLQYRTAPSHNIF
jgi:hypothetical protein